MSRQQQQYIRPPDQARVQRLIQHYPQEDIYQGLNQQQRRMLNLALQVSTRDMRQRQRDTASQQEQLIRALQQSTNQQQQRRTLNLALQRSRQEQQLIRALKQSERLHIQQAKKAQQERKKLEKAHQENKKREQAKKKKDQEQAKKKKQEQQKQRKQKLDKLRRDAWVKKNKKN